MSKMTVSTAKGVGGYGPKLKISRIALISWCKVLNLIPDPPQEGLGSKGYNGKLEIGG